MTMVSIPGGCGVVGSFNQPRLSLSPSTSVRQSGSRHYPLIACSGGGGGGGITPIIVGGGGGDDGNDKVGDNRFYWVKIRGDMVPDIQEIYARYMGGDSIDHMPCTNTSYGPPSSIDASYRSLLKNVYNIWGGIFGVGVVIRGVRELYSWIKRRMEEEEEG